MRFRQHSASLGLLSLAFVFLVIFLAEERLNVEEGQRNNSKKKHLQLKVLNLAEELTVRSV
jgi:hypothetical protein